MMRPATTANPQQGHSRHPAATLQTQEERRGRPAALYAAAARLCSYGTAPQGLSTATLDDQNVKGRRPAATPQIQKHSRPHRMCLCTCKGTAGILQLSQLQQGLCSFPSKGHVELPHFRQMHSQRPAATPQKQKQSRPHRMCLSPGIATAIKGFCTAIHSKGRGRILLLPHRHTPAANPQAQS